MFPLYQRIMLKFIKLILFTYLFFWPWLAACGCGILVPQPGIEPRPSAVRAQSPNYWTTRELPIKLILKANHYLSPV